MTKTEQLRALAKGMFERATEKSQIDELSKLMAAVDDVEKENKELTDKTAEAIGAYKASLKHTSFKDAPEKIDAQATRTEAPSLEQALAEFLKNNK